MNNNEYHSYQMGQEGFDIYIKRNVGKKMVCEHCKKEFIHYGSEVLYKYNNKVFCSWDCKCKYKRKHPQ